MWNADAWHLCRLRPHSNLQSDRVSVAAAAPYLPEQQDFCVCVSFLQWDVHLLTSLPFYQQRLDMCGLSASMLFYELV